MVTGSMPKLAEHRGFRLLFLCGLVSGAALLAWLSLGHDFALGGGAWFPFDTKALVKNLSLRGEGLHVPLEGRGILYWSLVAVIPVGLFLVSWQLLRREEFALERQILIQERRVEHAERTARAEQLWERFEASELNGASPDEQIELLDAYVEESQFAELAAETCRDRVARCREAARDIGQKNPQLALKVLRKARELRRAGKGMRPGVWPLVRHDVFGFALGNAAVLLGVPLVVLITLTVLGLVMWVVRLIVGAIVLVAIVGAIAKSR